MAVYVDDMHLYPMGRFGRMKMSHMIADTAEELHAMARAIGVARKWYQGDHYDIAVSRRAMVVEWGAREITLRECALMSVLRRRDPAAPLLTAAEGEAWLRQSIEARRSQSPGNIPGMYPAFHGRSV